MGHEPRNFHERIHMLKESSRFTSGHQTLQDLELEDDIGLRVCEDWSEYLIHALVDLL